MNEKITLPALINLLSEKTGKPKKVCEDFLREFFATLVDTLESGENIKIKGIGTFKVVDVEPRKSVNVNTGEEMEIPGHRKITFTPAKEMAEDVNSPFAMFESVEIDDNIPEETDEASEETSEETPESEYVIPETPAEESPVEIPTEETPIEAQIEEEIIEAPVEQEHIGGPEKEETIDEADERAVALATSQESEVQEEAAEPEKPAEEETEEAQSEELFKEYYEEKPKKRFHFLWGFLCGLFVTALAVAVCYFFMADKFNAVLGAQQDKEQELAANAVAPAPAPADTIKVTADSVLLENDKDTAVVEKVTKEPEVSVPTQPSDEKVYDTISKTRYLTTMAKAHYGNYNLWPIIYEENKAILGHPDRIRPGTRVVIPSLSKYGVDPNNPDDIAKAKKKGVEIYSRFK